MSNPRQEKSVAEIVTNIKDNIFEYTKKCHFTEQERKNIYTTPQEKANVLLKYPNQISRFLSEIMLGYYGKHDSFTGQWLQLGNFFFSVLPGIISLFLFIQRYSMSDAELASQQQRIRAFRGITTSFVLIGILSPLVITIFQMIVFDRLIFLKVAPPVLVGQTVSVIMWFLTWSGPVLKWFSHDLRMYHVLPIFGVVIIWTLILVFQGQPLNYIIAWIIIGVGSVLAILSAIPTLRWHKYFRIGLFMACLAIMVFLIYIRHFIVSDDKDRTQCRDQMSEWGNDLKGYLPSSILMVM